MAEGCCAKFIKVILIGFNLIFWIIGVAFLGVGIWALVDDRMKNVTDLDLEMFNTVTYVVIGVGAVTFVIGFLGCVGAWRENKCMLVMYAIFLFALFLAEVAAGAVGLIWKTKVAEEMDKAFANILDDGTKLDDTSAGIQEAMSNLQGLFKCCGINNYTDWVDRSTGSKGGTCSCQEESDKTDCDMDSSNNWVYKGCRVKFEPFLIDIVYLIGLVVLCLGFVQLIGFAFTVYLLRNLSKDGVV
ncbi:PREDICTED: tetraspanin-9-like [Branchiostoma belcheri]|uniref:Tetraspanin n=1 Tax=Branchiostoma belcheri TaxID=7741 RepID=A0A6P4YHA6_BRABE|nr:PREDICTED: tetraspanin-9-like [Branchiostoma belcheri]